MRKLIKAVKGYVYTVKVENGSTVETWHGESCEQITGYSAEAYRADPELWLRVVPEEDRDAVKKHAEKALAGEEQLPLEHRIIHRDGTIRWIKSTIVLNKDERGKLISYDGLISNISTRKSAEEALRESEQRYRRLLASVTDYMYMVRVENGAAVQIFHAHRLDGRRHAALLQRSRSTAAVRMVRA